MAKKKGDRGNPQVKAIRLLNQIAERLREECHSTTVSRTTDDGFTIPVPGFDSNSMDWSLSTEKATGSVTDIIAKVYGEYDKSKAHAVFTGTTPTSKLSRKVRQLIEEVFAPLYLKVVEDEELLEGLLSILDGVDRVEGVQSEYKLAAWKLENPIVQKGGEEEDSADIMVGGVCVEDPGKKVVDKIIDTILDGRSISELPRDVQLAVNNLRHDFWKLVNLRRP